MQIIKDKHKKNGSLDKLIRGKQHWLFCILILQYICVSKLSSWNQQKVKRLYCHYKSSLSKQCNELSDLARENQLWEILSYPLLEYDAMSLHLVPLIVMSNASCQKAYTSSVSDVTFSWIQNTSGSLRKSKLTTHFFLH